MVAPGGNAATVCCTLEELVILEKNGKDERGNWVRNPPHPPTLWRQFFNAFKDTLIPRPNISPTTFFNNNTTCSPKQRLFSLLAYLFPIFASFRNYNVIKFKNDLLAGLTLASLSIPQVRFRFEFSLQIFFYI